MRYTAEHKQQTRRRILDAACRRFRAEGYDGLGIDGLAKAAGVTNGAFYGHFASKADAFREVVDQGMAELRDGVEQAQQEGGAWLARFAEFYFSDFKVACSDNVCALPGFAPEVARAAPATRAEFTRGLTDVAAAMANGFDGSDPAERTGRAWAALAMMAGGVTLARAVDDRDLARTLLDSLAPRLAALQHPGGSE